MASTYSPGQAFDWAKRYIKNMNLYVPEVQITILNDALTMLWMKAPWRWSLGNLVAPFQLTTATQDYTITLPGDFLFLADVYLTDGQMAPRHLHIEPFLPPTAVTQGIPGKVAIIGSTTLRVYPKPGTQTSSPPYLVSTYKKVTPIITIANMYTAGTQVFDDEWFWVYKEGVLWRAYQYADDQRAGAVTYTADSQPGTFPKYQYTGQRGAFEAALCHMAEREKLPDWAYKIPVPDAETTTK